MATKLSETMRLMSKLLTVPTLFLATALAAPQARAERLTYLSNPSLYLAAYKQSIAAAKKTIDMSYWEFLACSASSGRALTQALIDKKRNSPNVRIRLLVDRSSYDEIEELNAMAHFLKSNGIEVKVFNDIDRIEIELGAFISLNAISNNIRYSYRTHAKYMIVDAGEPDARIIVGGRNIADSYFGMTEKEINNLDRDVMVENAVWASKSAMKTFETMWKDEWTTAPRPYVASKMSEHMKKCETPDSVAIRLIDYLEKNSETILAKTPKFDECHDVKFVGDTMEYRDPLGGPPTPHRSSGGESDFLHLEHQKTRKPTTGLIIETLTEDTTPSNKRKVVIENYSFLIGAHERLGTQVFEQLQTKKVPVIIYTNFFHGVDEMIEYPQHQRLVEHSGKSRTTEINSLEASAHPSQKWEFSLPNVKYSLHAKVFVANSKDAIISSYNIDPRSYQWNAEAAIRVKNCPSFAKHVEEQSKQLLKDLTDDERNKVNERARGRGFPAPVVKGEALKNQKFLDENGFL